jgi:uncharacterized membrane protein YbhN (UPF0104 family)
MRAVGFGLIYIAVVLIAASQHQEIVARWVWTYPLLLGAAVGFLYSGLNLFAASIRREVEDRVKALEDRVGAGAPNQPSGRPTP